MNAAEEGLILDAIEDAAHKRNINDNEYNRGILRGLDIVASGLNLDPNDILDAVQSGSMEESK